MENNICASLQVYNDELFHKLEIDLVHPLGLQGLSQMDG